MIRRFLAVLLLTPAIAMAQNDPPFCTREAAVFAIAASYRDNGLSPQQTWERIRPPAKAAYDFPEDVVKDIINTVYFDPEARQVPSRRMMNQVLGDCMNPPKAFMPLR